MKLLHPLPILLLLSACTTVTTMDGREITNAPPISNCEVTVYQTYQSAIARGPIEELCVVRGTSAYRLPHTIEVAIEKHKPDVCSCGTSYAYIQSATATGWDFATVTLVAFRYKK